jgi:ribonuclease D
MPTQPDLDAVASLARAAGRIGIDTEFVGEGRYRALLCLVQIAVDDPAAQDGIRIEVIDALQPHDPAPIAALLADPAIEIVMHAARQDVGILKREWRTEITNLFDTQIAAGFAGLGAQTGYGNLLHAVLGLRLNKSESFTRWDVRPLTGQQLAYAREDVEHLLQLTDRLQARLAESGRLEWAREECRALQEATDQRDPELAYLRLPRVTRLGARDLAVVRELAAWRERAAAAEDKPLGTILQDPALVEIAKRKPSDPGALEQIRGVQQRTMRRHRQEIIAAIQRGLEAEPVRLESAERDRSDARDAPLVSLAEALARSRAIDAGLAYELVATRSDVQAVVAASRRGSSEPDVRTLRGWRRELVGAELLDLLAGRRLLDVDPDGHLRVSERPGE